MRLIQSNPHPPLLATDSAIIFPAGKFGSSQYATSPGNIGFPGLILFFMLL